MRLKWGFTVLASLALTGCGEDYAGFCEEVTMLYYTATYDKFAITDIIDDTAAEQPRPEVYVRFTAMRQSGKEEKRNVTCKFDFKSGNAAATEILVDGRKISDQMVAQYNASFAQ